MKKCVIASDSFKGTLSSKEIADIFENEFKRYFPDTVLEKVVLGDGGENTLDVFAYNFTYGEYHELEVTGPNNQRVNAKYYTYGSNAVIELAQASGLTLATEKNPLKTTTYGVGELILDAYSNGFRRFYIALGGSATNDGGCGLLAALGVKFYDADGHAFIPTGGSLSEVVSIDPNGLKVKDAKFTILCDVQNPMYGQKGAAHVFGKQKGADPDERQLLDDNLQYLNKLFIKFTGKDVSKIPGTGAAGATSAGMLAFLNAEIVSGIGTILNIISFERIIHGADFIFTGEGKLDSQSFDGKLISGVLKFAKMKNIPTICLCGRMEGKFPKNKFYAIYPTTDESEDFESIKANAKENFIRAVNRCLAELKVNLAKNE